MNYWPWYTFHAITHLRTRLSPEMSVFEYGCGSSTLFFTQRCGEVQSIDHNVEWCAKVAKRLGEAGLAYKAVLHCVQTEDESRLRPDPLHPDCYYSKGWKCWFEKYAKIIRDFADGSFDVISVDGGARNSCIKEAIPKLKPGGLLILDNSERPRYAQGVALIPQEWERWDFAGKGSVQPWNPDETRTKRWMTSIWKRSNG